MDLRKLLMATMLAVGCAPSGSTMRDDSGLEALDEDEGVYAEETDEAPVLPPVPEWDDERPAPDAAGVGTLEVRDGTDLTTQLDLAQLSVEATVHGHVAAFEVEHRFDNPTDDVLEGTFRFPLPHGAVVTGLAMEIGGELMEGEVLDRDRAREIYQSIVDQMQDPALLEWEQGQTFKLRVFPIEARSHKRVVIRYLAPLHRAADDGIERWEVVVPTAAPTMQGEIGRLQVRVDGQTVVDRRDATPVGAVRVDVAEGPGDVLQTTDEHGTFTAVRFAPDWAQIPAPPRQPGPRRLLVVMDTSRSALESWGLARESLRIVLESLDEQDEFCVVASDLAARAHAPGFRAATADEIERARAFVDAIEPDGASDIGSALTAVGQTLEDEANSETTQVLVIGDGVPTWGQTDPEALLELATTSLGEVPLHALVLGRSAQGGLLSRIAGRTGGRAEHPLSTDEIEWFSGFLDVAPRLRRLRDVTVQAPGDHELASPLTTTLFEGQHPVAYVRTPEGASPPERLLLRGIGRQGDVSQEIAIGAPVAVEGMRHLWASHRIDRLQRDAKRRPEVVAMSERHGVLSRHTAFLVLESEEAYREHAIERRRAAEQAQRDRAPAVSGADLGEGGSDTSLRPGDLQPGDPEILIPAPRDAQAVTVVFPFGETKRARWDEATGKWVVRFLVDEDTEPGRYEVAVRVTMADGRVERLTAKYTVDMRAPQVSLLLVPMDDGSYELRARQTVTARDRVRERIEGLDGSEPERASVRSLDARSIEARLPDGQTLVLERSKAGEFATRWTPASTVEWPARVELVTTDRALNNRRTVEWLTPEVTP